MNALTDDDKAKLSAKYQDFKKLRDDLNIFLVKYIADFMRLQDVDPSQRKRYLRKKYGLFTPRINYQFNNEEGFCWSVRNIAIVLGRDRSSVSRVLSRMRNSDYWSGRVNVLHRVIKSYEGGNIDVYGQDIFDVLWDYYEEEYLQRFARPRHGDLECAPDIEDLREFWRALHGMEYIQKRVLSPTRKRCSWLREIINWLKRLTC